MKNFDLCIWLLEFEIMSNVQTKEEVEIKRKKPLGKPKELELVIIPKKEFLDWYKFMKGRLLEIEIKSRENGYKHMECPSCRNTMEDYYLINPIEKDLWHLCPHCNLTFSHGQYQYFRNMVLNLINR